MSQPTYAIEGTQLPEGRADPPARQEVTSWINNPDNARQVSLFMRALTEFQRLSPTEDPLSYYRVAGIHGNPDVSWDGVANPPGTTGRSSWWCAHNKETFASWHRPYLVLFEQRIYALMVATIAKNVPNDSQKPWEDAAREWRLPYWDWALTQPYINDLGVPEVFTKDRIDVVDFAGNTPPTMENIANPLAKFSNPTGTAMGDQSMGDFALTGEPWSNAIATSRHGIDRADVTASWVGGVNNWTKSNEAIQGGNGVTSIPDQIYRLFATDLSSWESFSSTKSQPPPRAIDFMSLEAIHNNIHGYTGGRDPGMIGHMGDTSVAAFDPIFWFHHCNVDHLAATFQTLHPDMWYDATTDLASTKLEPFHRDTKATSWTADATRDWKANLRYTYDDLEAPHPPRAFAAFRRLAARTIGRPRTGADNQPDLSLIRRRINEKYGTVQRQIMNSPDILGKENDYVINIIYDRYALDGAPYYIHFFLGDPPPDRDAFTHTDSYVGSMYTFSSKLEDSTNATRCGNCLDQRSEGILSTSQVPLTEAILRSVKHLGIPDLHTMEPDEVETYLQTHLVWRANIAIQEPGGAARSTMIDMSLLPKTKIFAMRGRVHYPESDSELSTYSNYTVMWRATSDKPGGAVESDAQPVS